MITKFATPFYPERFIRGNLNFLQNRLNRIFYEFINFDCYVFYIYFQKKQFQNLNEQNKSSFTHGFIRFISININLLNLLSILFNPEAGLHRFNKRTI
jgi:hypothetical protein